MTFEIDTKQCAKIAAWIKTRDAEAYQRQVTNCKECQWAMKKDPARSKTKAPPRCARHVFGRPYYGASGGAVTYSFTPTSIGTVIKIEHAGTDQELDVSDYENW